MSVEVDMILGDPSADAAKANRSYAAFQLSLECAKNEYLTDKDQRATYYLGAICCLMPEVTDDLQEAVRSMGRTVRTISFPSAAARNGLIVPPKVVEPKLLIALFSYLVIKLYRNDTEVVDLRDSFDQYLEALFDRTVLFQRLEEVASSVFNDVEHSTYLRTTYGQNHEIRKTILKGILNHTEDGDSFGFFCSYVANILAWTDMEEYSLTSLFLYGSPVLKVPNLADEVKNFNRAEKAVHATETPSYYMILGDPESYSMLDSSNFPTLTAISQKARSSEEIRNVDYYVAMHRIHLHGISPCDNAESDSDEED